MKCHLVSHWSPTHQVETEDPGSSVSSGVRAEVLRENLNLHMREQSLDLQRSAQA